ncbi:hypothetical protein F5Y10DRAFT_79622 [Nemania abortiva]|nr:hypothetical protein F5Y10DRAFT_79622 [Nemania abortiva]
MAQTRSRLESSDRQEQLKFLQCIWPGLKDGDFDSADYKRFFHFVDKHLNTKSDEYGEGYFDDTKDDMGGYIRRLREQPALTKIELVIRAGPRVFEDVLSRTFEMAASFLVGTIVDSDDKDHGIDWGNSKTLGDALWVKFGPNPIPGKAGDVHNDWIPPTLTLQHLCSRYKYEIHWTDDLTEHLVVDRLKRRITVYEHLICLWNNFRYSSSPLPEPIIKEAIDTLIILFPPNEKKTKDLLDSWQINFYRLGTCKYRNLRRLSEYVYWRDRMTELKYITDGRPRRICQLAWPKDGQNFVEFLTFWMTVVIAISTIVLGLVFGILMTVLALREERLNSQQKDIAVGIACSIPAMANALPKYCHRT